MGPADAVSRQVTRSESATSCARKVHGEASCAERERDLKRAKAYFAIMFLSLAIGVVRPARRATVSAMSVLHSLADATPEGVGRYAVERTIGEHAVVSGTPRILLARRVTTADLPALGFGQIGFSCEEPPLVLVILQGDFDLAGLFPSIAIRPGPEPAAYLAYIFDLWAGVPTLTSASRTVDPFRPALNAGEDDTPPAVRASPPGQAGAGPPCRYGAVAPTVVPSPLRTPTPARGLAN